MPLIICNPLMSLRICARSSGCFSEAIFVHTEKKVCRVMLNILLTLSPVHVVTRRVTN